MEYRVLRRIFGSRREEVSRVLRKLHNDELHDLYSSTNRVIKSRGAISAKDVACMGT